MYIVNPVLFAACTAPVVKETKKNGPRFPDRLLKLMREMFGPQNANWSKEREDMIEVTMDSCTALLDPHTLVSGLLLTQAGLFHSLHSMYHHTSASVTMVMLPLPLRLLKEVVSHSTTQ